MICYRDGCYEPAFWVVAATPTCERHLTDLLEELGEARAARTPIPTPPQPRCFLWDCSLPVAWVVYGGASAVYRACATHVDQAFGRARATLNLDGSTEVRAELVLRYPRGQAR